jgi:predicted ATPase
MLKKIKITNFLSCQDTEIEFDNITALIGRNAAGKSNILKTIEYCAQFAVGNMLDDDYFGDYARHLNAGFSIEFLIEKEFYKYERLNALFPDEENAHFSFFEELLYFNNGWKIVAERDNDSIEYNNISFKTNYESPLINSILSLLPSHKTESNIKNISNYLSGIKYYSLNDKEPYNQDSAYSDSVYKEWLSKKNKKFSIVMQLIHIENTNKELLTEIESLLGENSLNIIKKINIAKFPIGKSVFYSVKFHVKNAQVSFFQLSYGTQRVLAILLALLYDKNSTLLIEQPEDGIHSGLLKKLLPLCFQYAKYYNKQLIITTHSSEVINLFQPENIRLVKMTENGTKVLPLDKERMPFIHEFIENEGALFDLIDAMDDE